MIGRRPEGSGAFTHIYFPVCFLVFQNPTDCVKNCPLIDLEDSGSEQAGAVTPSLLHQDLAALGKGGVWGELAQRGPDSQGESKPIPLGECVPVFRKNWVILGSSERSSLYPVSDLP